MVTNETIVDTARGGAGWAIRPYREGDLRPMVATWNAVSLADGVDHVRTETEHEVYFSRPGFDASRQVIIVEGPRLEGLPENILPGFGSIDIREAKDDDARVYELDMVTHPLARPLGLGLVIADRLASMIREHEAGPGTTRRSTVTVKSFMSETETFQRELCADLGLSESRQFWTMACPLDNLEEPRPVEGITMRNYNFPADNVPAREAFNNSFSDHYGFHPSSEERWNYRMSSPLIRYDLTWLAEVDDELGKIAGFCVSQVIAEENEITGRNEAWIELLGTVREWRKRGLGRLLVLKGLHSFKEAGFATGMLGVDSESLTGAERLYEAVGFRKRDIWLEYTCALDALKA